MAQPDGLSRLDPAFTCVPSFGRMGSNFDELNDALERGSDLDPPRRASTMPRLLEAIRSRIAALDGGTMRTSAFVDIIESEFADAAEHIRAGAIDRPPSHPVRAVTDFADLLKSERARELYHTPQKSTVIEVYRGKDGRYVPRPENAEDLPRGAKRCYALVRCLGVVAQTSLFQLTRDSSLETKVRQAALKRLASFFDRAVEEGLLDYGVLSPVISIDLAQIGPSRRTMFVLYGYAAVGDSAAIDARLKGIGVVGEGQVPSCVVTIDDLEDDDLPEFMRAERESSRA